jgi:hypothetical protein
MDVLASIDNELRIGFHARGGQRLWIRHFRKDVVSRLILERLLWRLTDRRDFS